MTVCETEVSSTGRTPDTSLWDLASDHWAGFLCVIAGVNQQGEIMADMESLKTKEGASLEAVEYLVSQYHLICTDTTTHQKQ